MYKYTLLCIIIHKPHIKHLRFYKKEGMSARACISTDV